MIFLNIVAAIILGIAYVCDEGLLALAAVQISVISIAIAEIKLFILRQGRS